MNQKDLAVQNEVNWAIQVGEISANEMLSGKASGRCFTSIKISTDRLRSTARTPGTPASRKNLISYYTGLDSKSNH